MFGSKSQLEHPVKIKCSSPQSKNCITRRQSLLPTPPLYDPSFFNPTFSPIAASIAALANPRAFTISHSFASS